MRSDLIVANPKPLTERQEAIQERFHDFDRLVSNQWRPEEVAPELLPWLAWGMSVDAWSDEWTEEERAAAVRSSIKFHRVKGTLAGVKEAVRLAGAEFVRITRPPSTFFAAPSLTRAERDAFLARYPELRIYKFRKFGSRGFGMFTTGDFMSDPAAPSGMKARRFPMVSDAAFRYGQRVTTVDYGVETELNSVTRYRETTEGLAVDFTEVRKRGKAVGLFPGAFVSMFTVDHGAKSRIYRVRAEQVYSASQDRLHLNSVKPSFDVINYDSVAVAERGTRRGMYCGGSYPGGGVRFGCFLPLSTARERLYDRLYLFDPARAVESRGRSTHLGAVRFSMPHHHAEVTAKVRGQRNKRGFGRYIAGFLIASDGAKLHNVMRLLNAVRPASVKIGLNTKTVDVVKAGVGVKAGSVKAGELKEII